MSADGMCVARAMQWFWRLSPDRQVDALRELFEYAVETEYLTVPTSNEVLERIVDDMDAGVPIGREEAAAPRYRASGEPMISFK